MNETYDIFSGLPGNGPIWIETVHGLENARTRLEKLSETNPADYFVYDANAAKIVGTSTATIQITQPPSPRYSGRL
jgi:hypothetical protein